MHGYRLLVSWILCALMFVLSGASNGGKQYKPHSPGKYFVKNIRNRVDRVLPADSRRTRVVQIVSESGDRARFFVPPKPESFSDGSENNQEPPAHLLAPVLTPQVFVPQGHRPSFDEAEIISQAQAAASDYFLDQGLNRHNSVGTGSSDADGYGRIHVKMPHLYKNLPVFGSGLIVHFYEDGSVGFSDNVVRGIDLDVTPSIPQQLAESAALDAYGPTTRVSPEVNSRLLVYPNLEITSVSSRFDGNNSDDYRYQLISSDLAWEVTVSFPLPEVDDEVLLALISRSPLNMDSDAELREVRENNKTVAGHAEIEQLSKSFNAALNNVPMRYYFNAITGELLRSYALIDELDEIEDYTNHVGSGFSYYSGEVELNTIRDLNTGKYVLIDATRPSSADYIGNVVFDARNVFSHNPDGMEFMTDVNNSWGDGDITNTELASLDSTRRQTPGVDVAYGMQKTWDMFENVLGRNGPKGNGEAMRACVHYGHQYDDAHYNGGSDFLCFGDNLLGSQPGSYTTGTTAHELGHAFWTAEGITDDNEGEADALNEGHGDIQGGLLNMYLHTNKGQGNLISRLINFGNWRGRVRQPESYDEENDKGESIKGLRYWSNDLKNQPEHVGGLPFGRAVMHLANGGSSEETSNFFSDNFEDGFGGIGVTRAALIWEHAMSFYVVGKPDYDSIRTSFIDSAIDIFGFNSMQHRATMNAFHAIHVGAKANDDENPEIVYAKVFDINTTDLTAKVFAIVDDDTGLKPLRVNNYSNNGYYADDLFYGYASLARINAGTKSFSFDAEDSVGNTHSVQRSFTVPKNRNLIDNGDFEDGMDEWQSDSGNNYAGDNPRRAFIGNRYLVMRNIDRVSTKNAVLIPKEAKNVKLVFRLLVSNSTTPNDFLSVDIYDKNDVFLKNLDSFGADTDIEGRNFLNKGYLRYEYDLSEYAGEKIRVAFNNDTLSTARFYIDQVVMTYDVDPVISNPKVTLREWENTVSFEIPDIQGIEAEEIKTVLYYVGNNQDINGQLVTLSHDPGNGVTVPRFYAGTFLDDLGGGTHWVGAAAVGFDNKFIATSNVTWFHAAPFNELLANGGFEEGAWDLIYSSPPPAVEPVEDNINVTTSFDGNMALRMGSQGEAGQWLAGQLVDVPKQLKTLTFSARINMNSQENPDNNNSNNDNLYVEFWNNDTFALVDRFELTNSDEKITTRGVKDLFNRYWREEVSLQPGKYSNKNIVVRFVMEEDNGAATTYYIDNVSLHYTTFGLANAGLPPPPPRLVIINGLENINRKSMESD